MTSRCEVCSNLRPSGDPVPNRKLLTVPMGERDVVLCVAHARIAAADGVRTLEQLRDYYHETPGPHSIGRRSFVSRRVSGASVPPGVEQRRTGRRDDDAARR